MDNGFRLMNSINKYSIIYQQYGDAGNTAMDPKGPCSCYMLQWLILLCPPLTGNRNGLSAVSPREMHLRARGY